jgi:CHAT domain-containing protein
MFEKARSRNLQDALGGKTGPGLRLLQSRLAKNALLIECWISNSRTAALWITAERAGVVSRELTTQDIASIRGFAATLRHASDASWRKPARNTGDLLLSGIPMDAGIASLLIVPDGILCSIPFEALSTGSSKLSGQSLLERFRVSYLPSAALLMRERTAHAPAAPWRRQLIAFGDPLTSTSGVLPGDDRWSRLPESARELWSIARALPGRAALHMAAGDQKQYLFNGDAAGVPILHFSTHAAADIMDPDRSRILFTPESGKKGSEYLFRGELRTLRLEGADLVTLSACDTEAGKLSRGEGIQSFSRAFLAAGARSTVTTLWRVADGPTADLMQRFYQHLARGEAKAEALRSAKLDFLRAPSELSLPRYWGAFVLNGDGETPIPPVFSWFWCGVAAALAIATLIALYRFLRRFLRGCYLRPDPLPAAPLRLR